MQRFSRLAIGIVAGLAVSAASSTFAQETITIRVAEADSFGGEDLIQLIAYAKAGERGVNVEATAVNSDDVAFQAVLNGQVDIAVGAAYEAVANLEAPIRHICQVRELAYIPVVDKTLYQDWQDLDGETFAVHSRASGTEALARIIEEQEGITFGEITYVPGSEVRLVGMQRGNLTATVLDLTTSKILLESDPEKFGTLPTGDQAATDSALYARTEFLEENAEAVQILLEELLKAARMVNEDPAAAAAARESMGLLPDLPPEAVEDITPYHEEAVAAGIFPTDCGGERAAQSDIDFLTVAGSLTGTHQPEDFWDFDLLNAALAAVGTAPAESAAEPTEADATETDAEPAPAEGEETSN